MQVRTYVGADLIITIEVILPKMEDSMANEILNIIGQNYTFEQYSNSTVFINKYSSIYEVEAFIQEIVLGLKTYKRKKAYIDIHLDRIIDTYKGEI